MIEGGHMPETSVTLKEMLRAREERVLRQQALLKKGGTLVFFTMNIAGPFKNTPLIQRGFFEGYSRLTQAASCTAGPILEHGFCLAPAGCEGWFRIDAEPSAVKRLTVEIENADALGRLFDFDVLCPDGHQVSRTELGAAERGCLICGEAGRICASRRVHPVAELQAKTTDILVSHFRSRDLDELTAAAEKALLYEVCTTPKPGLVDRENNGSHRDMDIFCFLNSTVALSPYFRKCAKIGIQTQGQSTQETFRQLRIAGKQAETDMYQATCGVNTHKGIIFSMGILCGAMGRLWDCAQGLCRDADVILKTAGEVAAPAVRADFAAMTGRTQITAGEKLYARYGLGGVREQVAQGFPAVRETALPVFRSLRRQNYSCNDAGAITLVHLIAQVTDTNMIARSDWETQQSAAGRAAELLKGDRVPKAAELRELDRYFIGRNLSPGGCADLLAITYFLNFVEEGTCHAGEPAVQH